MSVSTITGIHTTAIPSAQPNKKAGPFHLALAEKSARITVIMGTGLIAIPTANGRKSKKVLTMNNSRCSGRRM
jgi:hypothetical protein